MQTSKTDAQDCIDFKSVLVFSVFNCTVSSYRQGLILHLHLCRNFPNAPWQCAACLFPQQLTTHHNPQNRPHWCLPEQTGPENRWVFVSLSTKTCNLFRTIESFRFEDGVYYGLLSKNRHSRKTSLQFFSPQQLVCFFPLKEIKPSPDC